MLPWMFEEHIFNLKSFNIQLKLVCKLTDTCMRISGHNNHHLH